MPLYLSHFAPHYTKDRIADSVLIWVITGQKIRLGADYMTKISSLQDCTKTQTVPSLWLEKY